MSCPTCDHTMQYASEDLGIFWCPRCGTVSDLNNNTVLVPKLVDLCRIFQHEMIGVGGVDEDQLEEAWHGIPESINLPGDRPK